MPFKLVSCFFVCFYRVISGFQNTKPNHDRIITTSSPTAPLKCSLRGEFLCGAVPQPSVSTQQDPRLIHGSYRRWIDCWRGAVSTPPRTNAARAWYVLATSNLLQRLRCLAAACKLPFAQGNSQSQKCCIMFGSSKKQEIGRAHV